jgi:7-cyano-7-deazaguanine synthase
MQARRFEFHRVVQPAERAGQNAYADICSAASPDIERSGSQETDAQGTALANYPTSGPGTIEVDFMTSPASAPKAVCLLSGGLDSATCLALARRDGYACYALSFDYGQRHKVELEAAARVAAALGAERHMVARIGLDAFGGSALTADIDVPKGRSTAEMGHGIPSTYVPARNTIFLSFALAWAEVLESADIFIGVNALDYSGYPDCRPEYIEAYERMANLATKAGVEGRGRLKIHTPLLRLNKAQIVKLAHELGVPFGLTHSCYDPGPGGRACGQCDACLLRAKGFLEAGLEDR